MYILYSTLIFSYLCKNSERFTYSTKFYSILKSLRTFLRLSLYFFSTTRIFFLYFLFIQHFIFHQFFFVAKFCNKYITIYRVPKRLSSIVIVFSFFFFFCRVTVTIFLAILTVSTKIIYLFSSFISSYSMINDWYLIFTLYFRRYFCH